jgi:acyl-[acyl-carrier-protein]-phospholipid O-acyltransferase/long-chain-fatty-acid--[acyl-carrier-protein] ligase
MKDLLTTRGFIAYISVVFLNAFIDLGHKIVVQNTVFKVYDGTTQIMLTAVVNSLILLPFILLFSPSGFISDKYPKNLVIRAAAWAAVVLTMAITVCYYQGWFIAAFCMTFLLAVQSAFYSPAKYGFIKPLVGKEGLGEGNGAVQAVTIVAILLGTFVYSIFFEARHDPELHHDEAAILKAIAPLGWMLIANSLLQLFFAYRIPQLEQVNRDMHFSVKDYITGRDIARNLEPILYRPVIRLSIIGLMMFWSISQVMLATFPAFAKESLGETNTVMIQGILASCGIGIMLGSLLAGSWSRHHIETGLIPIGAIGISVGLFLIPGLDSQLAHMLNFVMIGVMGGFFIVPLNALIQFHAGERELGKVVAGNNLIQNVGMLSFLVLTVVLSSAGASAQMILTLLFFVACAGSLYTVIKIPQSLVRFLLTFLMSRRYKVLVQGMRNLPDTGGVMLLGNHISWIDWAIMSIASPRPISFVMARSIYERWYLTWFFRMFNVIPIERGPRAQESLETTAQLLDEGEVVCLFPEGQITRTGQLTQFRSGYTRACTMTKRECVIVPFYLGGLWGSQFSRASDKLKTARSGSISREIVVAFGEPLPQDTDAITLKRKVFELSIRSWTEYADTLQTLPRAWIDAVKRLGNDMALADTVSKPLSASQALSRAVMLSRRIKRCNTGQAVGLIFPTSSAGILANMATLLAGKTVINLNFSAEPATLSQAIEMAELRCVFTSRKVMERLAERGIELDSLLEGLEVHYFEDLVKQVGKLESLYTRLIVRLLPAVLLKPLVCVPTATSATAAILFTSGSEGESKGVMLSHRSIMANIKQLSDVLNVREEDVMLAQLPLFHSFGLTVCQFMPLIEGLPVVCHPDPSDATGVAKVVTRYQATLMVSTSTFLRPFIANQRIHPLMLESLRMVVGGAEKLSDDVRKAFKLKFQTDVYEGYGLTETSPVASVNLPDQLDTHSWHVQRGNKPGTVGMPLPGTSFFIVDPDSGRELPIGELGQVMIGGCQVMKGYLNDAGRTAAVISEVDGVRRFASGDKGYLDADGFLTIVDRFTRFARIGNDSISLTAVEDAVRGVLGEPELELAALVRPPQEGSDAEADQSIVLLYPGELDSELVLRKLAQDQVNPHMHPGEFRSVAKIPKFGSGKTNYVSAQRLLIEGDLDVS